MMQEDQELTLTGATLTSNGGHVEMTKQPKQSHAHNDHKHEQCCENKNPAVPNINANRPSPQEMLDRILKSSVEEQHKALGTLIRLGTFEAFAGIVKALEEQASQVLRHVGQDGHSLLHWAAKRDDIRFLEFLCQRVSVDMINIASRDGAAGMRPLHWACTEGRLSHVSLLLEYKADKELVDASGCTPLLIAAQYGHANAVAFLLKRGANVETLDSSLDSALHWAAYKGSMPVCGLLLYLKKSNFWNPDAFGQTPLHLAALRGNTSVVRYLLDESQDAKALLYHKDKKNKTPLDLAISKGKLGAQQVLEQYMDVNRNSFRKQCKQLWSIHSWKVWLGCRVEDEVEEAPKLPLYITTFHMALAGIIQFLVFLPFHKTSQGVLWDKSGLHLFNIIVYASMWICFWKTWRTNSGLLDENHPATAHYRKLYEETLEGYAKNEVQPQMLQLCHSCHIARPLRSKHCRVARKCVLMFDHYCPFVGNTIGLDNYTWFYGFLLFLVLTYLGFYTALVFQLMRKFSIWLLLLGIYLLVYLGIGTSLLVYHSQLVWMNLTTNEHLNLAKYNYLQQDGRYHNQFDHGCRSNFHQRFCLQAEQYTCDEEMQRFLNTNVV